MDSRIISDILAQNKRREELSLSAKACPSSRGLRLRTEKMAQAFSEIRSAFSKDTDRIIHSPSYARYIDKTQVFSLFENDHITHRVLHVQLVSKIARSIGRALRLNEDLIEAISLGHDLGHVPFGHDGEAILAEICREQGIGEFTHNGQSARALIELENQGRGLNITIQVLDGILCHNGEILKEYYAPDLKKDKQQFLREYHSCFTQKGFSKSIYPMTLEGCVVRISDIIAYIGRDIEDAITIGMIKREDIPKEINSVLGNRNDKIVQILSNDLIEQSFGKEALLFSPPIFKALKDLMTFNYQKIYLNPETKQESGKIKKMFNLLFEELLLELETSPQSFIYRWANQKMSESYRNHTKPKRMVVDYIASMTDSYFIKEYKKRILPRNFGFKL